MFNISIAQINMYIMIKCALQYFLEIKSTQVKCWFYRRRENQIPRRKTSRSRVENQQTQPTYDAEPGYQTRATLVGGGCSDTAPTLLPLLCIYLKQIITRATEIQRETFGQPCIL